MIPILFESNATDFTTRGIGALTDAVKCTVTEKRNSTYELEMTYPTDGAFFDELTPRRIILACPSPYRAPQPFRIFKVEKALKKQAVIRAQHISYDLCGVPVSPMLAFGVAEALNRMVNHAMTACPFTVWTDKNDAGTFSTDFPTPFRTMLYGSEGSILDAYNGGEYEFDNFAVKLYKARGKDSGVRIAYGKNVTSMKQDIDTSSLITGVVPYWTGEGGTMVGDVVRSAQTYNFDTVVPYDFSADFEERPTEAQLTARATRYLTESDNTTPKVAITVDFADMSRFTPELQEQLERVDLCDTVRVICEDFSLNSTAEVISIETDVLLEKYNKLEIGQPTSTVAQTIATAATTSAATLTMQNIEGLLKAATGAITGRTGGYYRLLQNEDGQPYGWVISDNADLEQAQQIWQFTSGGMAHSSNGLDGPFDDAAISMDGSMTANTLRVKYNGTRIIEAGPVEGGSGSFRLYGSDGSTRILYIGRSTDNLPVENIYDDGGNNVITLGTAKSGNVKIPLFSISDPATENPILRHTSIQGGTGGAVNGSAMVIETGQHAASSTLSAADAVLSAQSGLNQLRLGDPNRTGNSAVVVAANNGTAGAGYPVRGIWIYDTSGNAVASLSYDTSTNRANLNYRGHTWVPKTATINGTTINYLGY